MPIWSPIKDGVIAFCYDLDVFGHGDTEGEALEDLRNTISDLFFELENNKKDLGSFLRKYGTIFPVLWKRKRLLFEAKGGSSNFLKTGNGNQEGEGYISFSKMKGKIILGSKVPHKRGELKGKLSYFIR